jgi:hypothetical protein
MYMTNDDITFNTLQELFSFLMDFGVRPLKDGVDTLDLSDMHAVDVYIDSCISCFDPNAMFAEADHNEVVEEFPEVFLAVPDFGGLLEECFGDDLNVSSEVESLYADLEVESVFVSCTAPFDQLGFGEESLFPTPIVCGGTSTRFDEASGAFVIEPGSDISHVPLVDSMLTLYDQLGRMLDRVKDGGQVDSSDFVFKFYALARFRRAYFRTLLDGVFDRGRSLVLVVWSGGSDENKGYFCSGTSLPPEYFWEGKVVTDQSSSDGYGPEDLLSAFKYIGLDVDSPKVSALVSRLETQIFE